MKIYKIVILLTLTLVGIYLFFDLYSDKYDVGSKNYKGEILRISEKKEDFKDIEIKILNGYLNEKTISVTEDQRLYLNKRNFKVGDKVLVNYDAESKNYFISDFLRTNILFWLFIIFLGVVILITKWQGLGSLAGMLISFLILFKFALPQILEGSDPIKIVIISSFLIIPVTFFSAHGFNRKSSIAAFATLITLIIAGSVAMIFTDLANLTGLASEEASFLKGVTAEKINFRGLLLAGMLIGILGILDDITVAQAAIVEQLKKSNPKLTFQELYKRAMVVGKDHIASMVNTIILIYTGSALPLMLLFFDYDAQFTEILNLEPIAEEIIRTLSGSLALTLAVPITTGLALILKRKNSKAQKPLARS